jgi:hypothetical protein
MRPKLVVTLLARSLALFILSPSPPPTFTHTPLGHERRAFVAQAAAEKEKAKQKKAAAAEHAANVSRAAQVAAEAERAAAEAQRAAVYRAEAELRLRQQHQAMQRSEAERCVSGSHLSLLFSARG